MPKSPNGSPPVKNPAAVPGGAPQKSEYVSKGQPGNSTGGTVSPNQAVRPMLSSIRARTDTSIPIAAKEATTVRSFLAFSLRTSVAKMGTENDAPNKAKAFMVVPFDTRQPRKGPRARILRPLRAPGNP